MHTRALVVSLVGTFLWMGCSSDPEDQRADVEAGARSAIEARTKSDTTKCQCLVMAEPSEYSTEQECLDDQEGVDFEACYFDAFESDPDLGITFANCLGQAFRDGQTCWSDCAATLDEQIEKDCFNKQLEARTSCFDPLPESMANAVSNCLKGV